MSIVDDARSWIAEDPDSETRRELETLIENDDLVGLEERFSQTLQFGTAGLRGLLGAGPNRMNRVTVSQATAGLCAWMKQKLPDAAARGIVVGRDARHNSDVFERDVIEVATGAGIPVWVFSDLVPTPVVAFAVLELRAAAGVMITASHNPRGYNGYKVYWENGAQIIPPHDRGISDEIDRAPAASSIPRLSCEKARAADLVRNVDSLRDAYVERIASEVTQPGGEPALRIAYTALHGVAESTFRAVFARAGFGDIESVREQAAPDGSFPTVKFPNPEEPGAMDHVLALAERSNADIAIANDPDGDRVAVAVRNGPSFESLSGNDIGLLLADDLLSQRTESGQPLVVSTIVSSPLMGPIAAGHGARWEQTLTGHKWIQNRAIELEDEGLDYVFGYEESLGYATSRWVRDKDGISAALRMADMAARLKARGKTLLDARDSLWRKYGYCADQQVSVRFDGIDSQTRMKSIVDGYRDAPPAQIGGQAVLRMLDVGRQLQSTPLGVAPFTDLAPSNLLIFELRGGHRVMLRPSGTEPKLKYYFYVRSPVHGWDDLASSKARAQAVLARMVADLSGSSDC